MMTEFPTPPPSIAHQIQLEDRLRPAVDEFNVKPSDGIQSLLSAFSLPETPKNIAHILHIVPNLNGSQIGEFLSKQKNEEALLYFFRENSSFLLIFLNFLYSTLRKPNQYVSLVVPLYHLF